MFEHPIMTAYIVALVFDLFGSGLFLWWWEKNKGASTMFIGVTFLLIGDAVDKAMVIYCRSLLLMGDVEGYLKFTQTLLWGARTWIELFATAYIIYLILKRIFFSGNYFKRRVGDQ